MEKAETRHEEPAEFAQMPNLRRFAYVIGAEPRLARAVRLVGKNHSPPISVPLGPAIDSVPMPPSRPETPDIAAARHGGQIIDMLDYAPPIQRLKNAEIERSAANAATGQRQSHQIPVGERDPRFVCRAPARDVHIRVTD